MSLLKIAAIAVPLILVVYFASLSYLTRHNRIKPEGERQLAPCPATPNCVSSLATEPSKKVEIFPLDTARKAASWKKLISAITNAGGEILLDDSHYVHAVFTSTLFRFRDDLEAELTGDHIDVRSASRAGKSDLGQNRKRVEKIRQIYLQE
jgi:uncharacterized protein (DUF1499 family)